MVGHIDFGERKIGQGFPCFIIAEVGVNHDGELSKALQMIDVAAEAGVDAVKFQTYKTEKIVSRDAPKADYQKRNDGEEGSQFEMIKRLELSEEEHVTIKKRCEERGVMFLSSPFDEESADFLVELGVPGFKVPSGEIVNEPFMRHLAAKQLPMIISTGMATVDEVSQLVEFLEEVPIVLLHCVSAYPADPKDCNLRAIEVLGERFGCPAGWSDHTPGVEVALGAVALGACVVEKHFTLDKNAPGPDHKASMEPDELRALVAGIRKIESALGDGHKTPAEEELRIAQVARKSLVFAQSLRKGEVIQEKYFIAQRPGTGLSPSRLKSFVGKKLVEDVRKGTQLALEMVED